MESPESLRGSELRCPICGLLEKVPQFGSSRKRIFFLTIGTSVLLLCIIISIVVFNSLSKTAHDQYLAQRKHLEGKLAKLEAKHELIPEYDSSAVLASGEKLVELYDIINRLSRGYIYGNTIYQRSGHERGWQKGEVFSTDKHWGAIMKGDVRIEVHKAIEVADNYRWLNVEHIAYEACFPTNTQSESEVYKPGKYVFGIVPSDGGSRWCITVKEIVGPALAIRNSKHSYIAQSDSKPLENDVSGGERQAKETKPEPTPPPLVGDETSIVKIVVNSSDYRNKTVIISGSIRHFPHWTGHFAGCETSHEAYLLAQGNQRAMCYLPKNISDPFHDSIRMFYSSDLTPFVRLQVMVYQEHPEYTSFTYEILDWQFCTEDFLGWEPWESTHQVQHN